MKFSSTWRTTKTSREEDANNEDGKNYFIGNSFRIPLFKFYLALLKFVQDGSDWGRPRCELRDDALRRKKKKATKSINFWDWIKFFLLIAAVIITSHAGSLNLPSNSLFPFFDLARFFFESEKYYSQNKFQLEAKEIVRLLTTIIVRCFWC